MRILRTRELVKTYNKKKVVDHISIEVKQGEVVGLLGPNGAGKTTTFYMTTGFIPPDRGQVYFEEDGKLQDITHTPMYKRARLGIGYLPQEASIFRKLTV
ncbi:MAG TPA: ATP-binding cassette domain-containing protein, partial [bacterium]|nr:ATP-binding cassette domain-containing protein [bacterium]